MSIFGRVRGIFRSKHGLEDDLSKDPMPRLKRYWFAHVALRDTAFYDPITCIELLGSEDCAELLGQMCDHVNEMFRGVDDQPDLHPDQFLVQITPMCGGSCALVEMPRAVFATEVHFVAIATAPLPTPAGQAEQTGGWYFTLEKCVGLDGAEFTVFCEWTPESHLNHGVGPPVNGQAFLAHVSTAVEQRRENFRRQG